MKFFLMKKKTILAEIGHIFPTFNSQSMTDMEIVDMEKCFNFRVLRGENPRICNTFETLLDGFPSGNVQNVQES